MADLDTRAFDELFSKQACTELIYQIARGVDRRDAALIRSAFHPDGTDDHGRSDMGAYQGPAAGFADWATAFPMDRSHHHIGNVLIEIDGDTARSESYWTAQHQWDVEEKSMTIMAAGRYLDTFARRDGVWKVAHRHAIYDWTTVEPSTDSWARDSGDRTYGVRGPDDASYQHLRTVGRAR